MSATASQLPRAGTAWPHIGWAAVLSASWTLAGGAAGGLLAAALTLAGRLHVDAVPFALAFFVIAGSTLGTMHGAVLGYLGRPLGTGRDPSVPRLAAPAAVVLAFGAALLIGAWLAAGALMARTGRAAGWGTLLFGATAALSAAVWASWLGWHALENTFARWPEHRMGSRLVLGAFAVLLPGMLAVRPAIPGTQLQLPLAGCVLLAVLATLWVAAPAVVIALRMVRHDR